RTLDYLVQLAAFDELHAEITGAIPLADFVNGDDARMIEAGGGFRLQTETLEMRLRGPLAETDDFQRHCAVKTFLPRTKHHALTAATDFFQQFVIAQLSQHLGGARCFFTMGSSRSIRFNIFSGAAVTAAGYRCVREQTKRGFEKASWAASLRCVGWDFRAALWAKSEFARHCRRVPSALPSFTA